MEREDVAAFIRHLVDAARDGFVPVSWNGLAFDFDVLAAFRPCWLVVGARGHV
jgi:hypothetical protein